MTMTADMIITRQGTVLPLDQRRRDALMTYAQGAADAAGMPRQTWCRKVWKLQDYEAKDLLRGNASEVVWERILKLKGEHCGWHVALPVLGAVIGTPVHAFFQDQMKQAAKAAEHAQRHEQLAAAAYRTLEGRSVDPREDWASRATAGTVRPEASRRLAGRGS
jgi:lipopolysaccharide biosynthesis protein